MRKKRPQDQKMGDCPLLSKGMERADTLTGLAPPGARDVTGAANMDKSYTIGHDHIAQWDDSTGDVLYLLADGHGSTRE